MIDGFAKKHLPQSEELFNHISKLDFENGDYFCFKSGGDGDNGEVLMDYFDDFFAKNNQKGGEVEMPDREKVIKGIDSCLRFNCGKDCTYYDNCGIGCTEQLRKDIIALLKKQETKQVKQVELYGQEDWYGLVCKCPDCKAIWMGSKSETHFCPNCGQKVKWE